MLGEPDWKSMNFLQTFWILTGIPRRPLKVLQNSGISQAFESPRFGILQKLLLAFLEILKFLGTQFSVVPSVYVDIFWNSPIGYCVLRWTRPVTQQDRYLFYSKYNSCWSSMSIREALFMNLKFPNSVYSPDYRRNCGGGQVPILS